MGKLLDSDVVKKALIDAVDDISLGYMAVDGIKEDDIEGIIDSISPAKPEYEPASAEDFAKVMSETTIYNYMTWYGQALALMKEMGFVICKRTM